ARGGRAPRGAYRSSSRLRARPARSCAGSFLDQARWGKTRRMPFSASCAGASGHHGVQRIMAHYWAAVEPGDPSPVARRLEELLDELLVTLVVEHLPRGDRLGGKAPVGEGDHERAAGDDDAAALAQHLVGMDQVAHQPANP